jgi:hypothetical protein
MVRSAARRSRAHVAGLPQWIRPQLTQLVDEAPDGPEWLHEIKFDGYRMHARLDRGAVRPLTRTGLDRTHNYPAIASGYRHSRPGKPISTASLPTRSPRQPRRTARKAGVLDLSKADEGERRIAEGNTDGHGRREVAQHDRWPRRSSGRSVGSDHSSRLRQIVDQGLRGFEVACVEPLREPFVDRREKLARFLASGVGLPQPGEARGSAKFQ